MHASATHLRSSADPLFESAAKVLGPGVVGVVLSGGDSDASEGEQCIKQHGGTVLAQDEATSRAFSMPRSAIATGAVDRVLPLGRIGPAIVALVEERRRH
jgi:two-component system chemotaxis response regulator CheB